MNKKKEPEFKDDGYTYCPVCDGTKFGPNMNYYAKYLPLDLLKDTDMCFCEFCGRKGKIDYISYAMGERFISESKRKIDCHSSEDYVVLVNDFIFIYTLFNIDGIISQIINKYTGNLKQIREYLKYWLYDMTIYNRKVLEFRKKINFQKYINRDVEDFIDDFIDELFDDHSLISHPMTGYVFHIVQYYQMISTMLYLKSRFIVDRTLTKSGLNWMKESIESCGIDIHEECRVSDVIGNRLKWIKEKFLISEEMIFESLGYEFKNFEEFLEMIRLTENSKGRIASE